MSSKHRPEVVVVTGSSGGVGRAIAHAFARRGAHVGLLVRGQDGLEAAAGEVEALGGQALAVATDVSDHRQVEAAAAAVEERFGDIDVWVNDAMATVFARFVDTEPEEFKRATEVTRVQITMVQLPGVNTPQFSWCRSKLPDHPMPVPPIYQPEIPAEAVYCQQVADMPVSADRPDNLFEPVAGMAAR